MHSAYSQEVDSLSAVMCASGLLHACGELAVSLQDGMWPERESLCVGKPMEGDQLQAEVASLIVGGLDTTAQTCSFTLCGSAKSLVLLAKKPVNCNKS